MKCTCGKNMICTDTREHAEGRRRRYKCSCGLKISTVEMPVEGTKRNVPVGVTLRKNLYAEFKAKAYDEIYADIAVKLKEIILGTQDNVR